MDTRVTPRDTAASEVLDALGQASAGILLEQLPVAVVLAVAPSGRIVHANRAARRLLPGELTMAVSLERFPQAQHPDGTMIEAHELPMARALSGGEVTEGERIRFRLPDSTWRTVEIRAGPILDEEGNVVAAVSTYVDVSLEERRELADREFVANAAHQLRNPLAAIRSAVEVLQAGAKDEVESRDRFLAHIERESARLTRLARALLLLARSQTMVESPRSEIVSLAPLLDELTSRVNPETGVSFEVRCRPELAAVANAELLEEALTCLVDNAARHGGGAPVLLHARRQGGSVAVEVRDTGPGIPAEVQQRIYERFYRSGEGSGFGLGLAIATQAVEAMGARLDIESTSGTGTVARLTLPAARVLGR